MHFWRTALGLFCVSSSLSCTDTPSPADAANDLVDAAPDIAAVVCTPRMRCV